MQPFPWFDRKFDLGIDNSLFPNICERLRGTPARLEEKIRAISPDHYLRIIENKWSIQEQVGHLLDLEPLWYGRVEDILSGEKGLREADLTNAKTHEAGHNEKSMEDLLPEFRRERAKLLQSLDGISPEILDHSALHPRLKTPMKIIDLAFFVAEHDDHHLAYINWLAGL